MRNSAFKSTRPVKAFVVIPTPPAVLGPGDPVKWNSNGHLIACDEDDPELFGTLPINVRFVESVVLVPATWLESKK